MVILCKCIPKINKNCFFSLFLISWSILIWFALSGRAKFGTLNFYTEFEILLHWLFMVLYANEMKLCPFQASNFYFLTSSKVYHIKFTIFFVARCGWALRHWRSGYNNLVMIDMKFYWIWQVFFHIDWFTVIDHRCLSRFLDLCLKFTNWSYLGISWKVWFSRAISCKFGQW